MKTMFVVLMSLIIYSSVYSQENPSRPEYALSFGISDNFRLDKFIMDIAVKKIFDEAQQVRFFISPRISTMDQEEEYNGVSGQMTEGESSSYSFGLGADYLCILISDGDINMFAGTGLVVSYGKNYSETTSNSTNGDINHNESKERQISAGIRGTVGVEWMVSENIGIHSEYLFTGSYSWRKLDSKYSFNGVENPGSKRTVSGMSLTSTVLFGLSIYF